MQSGGGRQSQYKYVCWRKAGTFVREGWIAQVRGVQKGPFRTEEQAASVASENLGLEVSDLLKQHAVSPALAVERFRSAHVVYSGCLLGDLESSRLHLTLSKAMFSDDPALEVLSLQGKMGPWKFQLYKAWVATRPRSQRSRPLSEEGIATRTATLAKILQADF